MNVTAGRLFTEDHGLSKAYSKAWQPLGPRGPSSWGIFGPRLPGTAHKFNRAPKKSPLKIVDVRENLRMTNDYLMRATKDLTLRVEYSFGLSSGQWRTFSDLGFLRLHERCFAIFLLFFIT